GAPLGRVCIEGLERRIDAIPERLLEVLARQLAFLPDGEEVELGSVVTRGLIERMLDDDIGVFGEVDADDDAVSPHAAEKTWFTRWRAHAGHSCTPHAAATDCTRVTSGER